ncbi:hypothetical protein EJ04DRAFT_577714 [Polyplosphaeria fusca]|uniref:C2H2-type domain-containing protein n=1 Tax=Polyplosphaeria fusca TaxID=682080 RepID=A0A9P4QY25_9PLEO|nr:hypothetical protein EJ04DRAFT_577714 [Polyplosphaeria fusca]
MMASAQWLAECTKNFNQSELLHLQRAIDERAAQLASPTLQGGSSIQQPDQGPPLLPAALPGPDIGYGMHPSTLPDSAQSSATVSLRSLDISRAENSFLSNQTLGSRGTSIWSDTTAAVHGNRSFDVGDAEDNFHFANEAPVAEPHEAPIHYKTGGSTAKGPYYCPLCLERGNTKTRPIITKHDWRRHIVKFHETNAEWCCSTCHKVFDRDVDAKTHYRKSPNHQGQPHFVKSNLPAREAYACGFMHCYYNTSNFDNWSNHVAKCMDENPGAKWSYDRRVHNLLRHPLFSPEWKQIREHWCSLLQLPPSALHWKIESSSRTCEQLERVMYGSDLHQTLLRLFEQGHPQHRISDGFNLTNRDAADVAMVDVQSQGANFPQSFPTPVVFSQYDDRQVGQFQNTHRSTDAPATPSSLSSQRVALEDYPYAMDPFLGHSNGIFQEMLGQPDGEGISAQDLIREETYSDSMNTTPPLPHEHFGSPSSPSRLRNLFRGTSF